ncbi:hypothetical protein ABWI00_16240 [Algihabitans albus]|uniref:SDH family Clp fold serine proteinase n=1 Tax=Algihabitans albus TaxID=2164067 RepID=UPI0035CF059A
MPTWNEINKEVDDIASQNACDVVRAKYLSALSEKLEKPVIAYYSGWLQQKLPNGAMHQESAVTDIDMNGLMAAAHGVDKKSGLYLILHTPGGDIEAGRVFIEYLYKIFGYDIHAIIPQMAMSVGTMIACGCKSIVMGKQSSLGPTDPQISGIPAMGVLAEVDRAIKEIKNDQTKALLWQRVFDKYPPAFISNCERAIEQTRSMVADWLVRGMLSGREGALDSANKIVSQLMDYTGTSAHNHHFLSDKCKEIGLNIIDIEDDQDIQEYALSVHHSFMITFARSNVLKIIENSNGNVWSVDQI